MNTPSIRVNVYLRGGDCQKDRLISTRILRPLTNLERRAGLRDEYSEWVETYGVNNNRRRKQGDRHRHVHEQSDAPQSHTDIPEELQLEIYKEMLPSYRYVARRLLLSGAILECDMDFVIASMQDICRDALPDFDPSKSSRKSFLRNVLDRKVASLLRKLNAKKRKCNGQPLSIVAGMDDLDVKADSVHISEEVLADPRSLQGLEFNLTWRDLENLCDPDERLALHMLYTGHTPAEVSGRLRLSDSTFRRRVLGSLQLKCDFVGFSPVKAKFILK